MLPWFPRGSAVYAREDDPEIRIDNQTDGSYTRNEITVHQVTVGNLSHAFSPNSINAQPGDIISFSFWPGDHSVIRAAFGYPCVPFEYLFPGHPGFYSGIITENTTTEQQPTWNLTINDTGPVFFYCGAPGSCIGHAMLGEVNAVEESPLVAQMRLAKDAVSVILPGANLSDAVLHSLQLDPQTSKTSARATPTLGRPAASITRGFGQAETIMSTSHASSNSSGGVIAGSCIGGFAIVGIAAGLLYLFHRRRASRISAQVVPYRNTSPPYQCAELEVKESALIRPYVGL
ncbi:hypothetical protein LTR95_019090, partial [Oleoguttula sp. CCFEE 5521]